MFREDKIILISGTVPVYRYSSFCVYCFFNPGKFFERLTVYVCLLTVLVFCYNTGYCVCCFLIVCSRSVYLVIVLLRTGDAGKAFLYYPPVDYIPQGVDMFCPPVLIVEIIGVFPYIYP